MEQIYVAGGFGKYLRIEQAQSIGLFPEVDVDKFTFVGNGSLLGARLVSFSKDMLKAAEASGPDHDQHRALRQSDVHGSLHGRHVPASHRHDLLPRDGAHTGRDRLGRSVVGQTTRTVAVAGKGGTGKTTLSGLLIRELLARGRSPILAVDADPNANLGEVLGTAPKMSVGAVREQGFMGAREIPTGWDKQSWIEYKMHEALAEADGYDLLVMGRPEGPGCYCYANNLFREYIKTLAKEYPWVVMDNEGGLEHLSRHTTRDVDVMFIVTDPTVRGMRTVERISGLIDEMGLVVAERYVVVNRVPADADVAAILELHFGAAGRHYPARSAPVRG